MVQTEKAVYDISIAPDVSSDTLLTDVDWNMSVTEQESFPDDTVYITRAILSGTLQQSFDIRNTKVTSSIYGSIKQSINEDYGDKSIPITDIPQFEQDISSETTITVDNLSKATKLNSYKEKPASVSLSIVASDGERVKLKPTSGELWTGTLTLVGRVP